MVEQHQARIGEADLKEHPAYLAWRELQFGNAIPERIEILKGKLHKYPQRNNRLVYRLVGVGSNGYSVIGKLCERDKALIEKTIYEEILPQLPITSLNYYGTMEAANREYCWIFLEYVGERAYSRHSEEHRQLGAHWLAQMHTSTSHKDLPVYLPDKGSRHYLKRLRSARNGILQHLTNHVLQPDVLATYKNIVDQCDLLESHWAQLEKTCEEIPQTLVHGDFIARNLRVRDDEVGMTLIPFDWGEAGWGVPAPDIMHVEVHAYWSMARNHWPWLNAKAVQRSTIIGKIFRCLDAINWELPRYKYGWPKRAMRKMRIYNSWLNDAIRAAGLDN
jgi:hypothetical protein